VIHGQHQLGQLDRPHLLKEGVTGGRQLGWGLFGVQGLQMESAVIDTHDPDVHRFGQGHQPRF